MSVKDAIGLDYGADFVYPLMSNATNRHNINI